MSNNTKVEGMLHNLMRPKRNDFNNKVKLSFKRDINERYNMNKQKRKLKQKVGKSNSKMKVKE